MAVKNNYWILVIDSLEIDLSLFENSDDIIEFSYDYINKEGDFKNLSNDDLILGYYKNSHSFKYLFKTKNKSESQLFLEKCLSVSKGIMIEDLEYKKMLNETYLLQVDEEIFFNFYKNLAKSIPFYSQIESLNITENTKSSNQKRNRIFFGAPGTGKSFKLNDDAKDIIKDDDYERITFHPDYSYSSFVGSYKPVQVIDKDTGKPKISYEYVPGPFMRILSKSINDESKNFLLIIEEINRANVAAVFGEVFQLLDRNSDYESEYPINTSKEMKDYLTKEFKKFNQVSDSEIDKYCDNKFKKIRIPRNMFIWATMNSADQGVFFMDAAFKRRWDFKHIDIDEDESKIETYKYEFPNGEEKIYWNILRKSINKFLLDRFEVKEDKLLGPYFISGVVKFKKYFSDSDFIDSFKNKVLMYLFEDAAKSNPHLLFNGSNEKTYSKICNDFEKNGLDIFHKDILKEYVRLKEEYLKKLDKNDDSGSN